MAVSQMLQLGGKCGAIRPTLFSYCHPPHFSIFLFLNHLQTLTTNSFQWKNSARFYFPPLLFIYPFFLLPISSSCSPLSLSFLFPLPSSRIFHNPIFSCTAGSYHGLCPSLVARTHARTRAALSLFSICLPSSSLPRAVNQTRNCF